MFAFLLFRWWESNQDVSQFQEHSEKDASVMSVTPLQRWQATCLSLCGFSSGYIAMNTTPSTKVDTRFQGVSQHCSPSALGDWMPSRQQDMKISGWKQSTLVPGRERQVWGYTSDLCRALQGCFPLNYQIFLDHCVFAYDIWEQETLHY